MTPDPGQLGTFVIISLSILGGIVMLLTGINQARKIIEKTPPKYATSEDLVKAEERLGKDMLRLEGYVRERFHDFGSTVQVLVAKIEALPYTVKASLDPAISDLDRKVDRNTGDIIGIQAREKNRPNPNGDP